MAKDRKPTKASNVTARHTVEQNGEQAIEEIIEQTIEQTIEQPIEQIERATQQMLRAVDNYFNFLQGTISSYPSGGTELGEKLKSYAQQSIAATHEFVQKLSRAGDFHDIARIQTEYMQTQLNAFVEQIKNLGEASAKAAGDAMKTKMPFNPFS
jgi:hypothetical protein